MNCPSGTINIIIAIWHTNKEKMPFLWKHEIKVDKANVVVRGMGNLMNP